jgi:hypothetical protein
MEAMLGIFLYSYPYLNQRKFCLIIVYVFASTKLEERADVVLPVMRTVEGMEGLGGKGEK